MACMKGVVLVMKEVEDEKITTMYNHQLTKPESCMKREERRKKTRCKSVSSHSIPKMQSNLGYLVPFFDAFSFSSSSSSSLP